MPNVLSPRDLVSRPNNMGETVLLLIGTAFFCMYFFIANNEHPQKRFLWGTCKTHFLMHFIIVFFKLFTGTLL